MNCNKLFVDIGNTNIHFKCSENYSTSLIKNFSTRDIPVHKEAIISCVAHTHLLTLFPNKKVITPYNYSNIIFNYSLKQLGVDRFLAIIAAFHLFSNTDVMIIDIGTCITIDYIVDNVHHSGGITPGTKLMQKCFDFSGKDSINAWNTGINNMILSYLYDKINAFSGNILLTGGGQHIINITNPNISYHKNLVITGLKIIDN